MYRFVKLLEKVKGKKGKEGKEKRMDEGRKKAQEGISKKDKFGSNEILLD